MILSKMHYKSVASESRHTPSADNPAVSMHSCNSYSGPAPTAHLGIDVVALECGSAQKVQWKEERGEAHPLKDAGRLGHIADEGDDGHVVGAGHLGEVPKG